MRLWALGLLSLVGAALAAAPTSGTLTFEDRTGPTGHTLVVDGKAFGPYREVSLPTFSTSGTALAFVVKRDRLFVWAQGKESGPLPAGYDVDRLQISDDGKVWVLSATKVDAEADDAAQTLLWVNGRSYGPYQELTTVEYAETGGSWIAAVRTGPEEADVLWNGKPLGPFYTVEHAWLSPDGKAWGYAASDSEGQLSLTTQDRTWTDVVAGNFANLYPREPHWGYGLRFANGNERIVVDGVSYEGYRNFQGLILTPSGLHWGFEASKVVDGAVVPVVVVEGKEYPGTHLNWSRLGFQETFTWIAPEGPKTRVRVLHLP